MLQTRATLETVQLNQKVTTGRRHFLGTVAAISIQVCSGGSVFGYSIHPVYRHIETIIFRTKFWFNGRERFEDCDDSMLEEVVVYARESIKDYPTKRRVSLRSCSKAGWPEDGSDPTTLRVIINVSIREVKAPDYPFDGFLGAVGVRLEIRDQKRGLDLLPVEPFSAPADKGVLRATILEAIKRQIDRAIIQRLAPVQAD